MTCRECELLLAEGADCEEHLRVCSGCHAFAQELRENAAALGEMGAEEYVLEHAPARGRPPGIWIGGAAAAMLLLALAPLWPRKPALPFIAPPPVRIASSLPMLPLVAAASPLVRFRKVRQAQPKPESVREETMLVKMLTPDPDVVVYWIVEPKEKAE